MTRKTTYFEGWSWFKFNHLERHYLWPWNFTPVWQRVKIKRQKVLEANSNVCRSYIEKLVEGGSFLPPKSWIELNDLKWDDFFCRFYKRATHSINCRRLCQLTICTKLCLRDQSINLSFQIRLADKSCPPFSSMQHRR